VEGAPGTKVDITDVPGHVTTHIGYNVLAGLIFFQFIPINIRKMENTLITLQASHQQKRN
jgi:hypothetical protein